MISSTPKSTTTSSNLSPPSLNVPRALPRSLRKSSSAVGLNSSLNYSGPALSTIASSSNLHSLYNSSSNNYSNRPSSSNGPASLSTQQLLPPLLSLSKKPSLTSLNSSALAAVPDASDSYALSSVLGDSNIRSSPSRSASRVGNHQNNNMADDLAVGDLVDVPNGAGTICFIGPVNGKKGVFIGIELLPEFANRGKNNGDVDGVSYFTPSIPGSGIFVPIAKVARRDGGQPATPTVNGLKAQNGSSITPPTPLPKFNQSVGPGRASSPLGKKPRPSLGRPESPVRRLAMTPGPRPSLGAPGVNSPSKNKYGSPTTARFSQSVRGTAGDPAKKQSGSRLDFKSSMIGNGRSSSALGMGPMNFDDDEPPVPSLQRAKTTNGTTASPGTRGGNRPVSRVQHGHHEEEVERLKAQIEDRDRQLKDQAATLSEMEGALAEVQQLMDNPQNMRPPPRDDLDNKDISHLRALLREKNDKIAQLTAEFDSHRADFRSTIDALEMASTETVRVYEAQKKDLMQEINELEARLEDVDAVARQLKQLEELVQELEEGLEDARRGEAEARGEVEFLRGEVERTRSELRREREKNGNGGSAPAGQAGGEKTQSALSKELEQKEDEIRGLKAIIHSLSRDTAPNSPPISTGPGNGKSVETRLMREKQERELNELRAMIDKTGDETAELQRHSGGSFTSKGINSWPNSNSHPNNRSSGMTVRPSLRDSGNGLARDRTSGPEPRMPPSDPSNHKRASTLDTMPESDTYSTATEASALWCEICETNGHDILTCTNMFGPNGPKPTNIKNHNNNRDTLKALVTNGLDLQQEYQVAPLKSKSTTTPTATNNFVFPPPVTQSQSQSQPTQPKTVPVAVLPTPMEAGPAPGKSTGVIDPTKWCAVCERDGHDSVDCPYEDMF